MSLHFFSGLPYLLPLILPRGSGQKQKLKAASAGGKEGKLPVGYRGGRANQRPKRQAPHGAPPTLTEPVPRLVQPPGMQGAKPLA